MSDDHPGDLHGMGLLFRRRASWREVVRNGRYVRARGRGRGLAAGDDTPLEDWEAFFAKWGDGASPTTVEWPDRQGVLSPTVTSIVNEG